MNYVGSLNVYLSLSKLICRTVKKSCTRKAHKQFKEKEISMIVDLNSCAAYKINQLYSFNNRVKSPKVVDKQVLDNHQESEKFPILRSSPSGLLSGRRERRRAPEVNIDNLYFVDQEGL